MAIYQTNFVMEDTAGTQVLSGFGSDPVKAVIFQWIYSTAVERDGGSNTSTAGTGIGMGFSVGTGADDNVASHTVYSRTSGNTTERSRMVTGSCISLCDRGGAMVTDAYVSVMGNGTFTLTYTDGLDDIICFATVFTGADMEASIDSVTPGTSSSNISVTGLSFEPKVFFTMTARSVGTTTAHTGDGDAAAGYGAADAAGNCYALGWTTDTGSAGAAVHKMLQDSRYLSGLPFVSGSGWDGALGLSSVNSSGYVLSVPATYGSSRPVIILSMGGAGIHAHVGNTTKSTASATTTQNITGAAFEPHAILMQSANSTAANDTTISGISISSGMSVGTTYGALGIASSDPGVVTSRRFSSTALNGFIAENRDGTSGQNIIGKPSAYLSDGVTYQWTTNTSDANRLFYVMLRYSVTEDYDERANPTVQTLAQTYGTVSHIIRENLSTTRVDVLAQTYGTAVLNITQHLPVNTLTVQTYGTDYEAMKELTNRVDVLAQTYGTIGLNVADSAGSVQILSQTYGSVSHLINEHTNIVTVLVNVSGFSGITETGNPIVLLTQTYGTDRADYKELLYPNIVLVSTTGIGNHTASELAGLSTILAQTYGSVIHQMVEDTVIQTVLAQVYGIDSALFLESSGATVDVNVETYGVAGLFSLEHSGPIVIDISTLGTDISNVLEYLNNVTVVVETLGFTIETEADGFVTVLVQTFGSDGFDLTFPVRYRVANLHTQNPYAVSLRVRR